ncbi:Pathogenesis-related protein 5, partial [Mucuna pruriens]
MACKRGWERKHITIFKNTCPSAYSYAYDDKTSTFTCASTNYTITSCPSPATSKGHVFFDTIHSKLARRIHFVAHKGKK